MQTLHLPFVAPIPVGHRVRVTFFEEESKNRLVAAMTGRGRGALVVDRETGIEYGSGTLWRGSMGDRQQFEYSDERVEALRPVRVVTGRVAACRVISRIGNAGNHRIATVLRVEVETDDTG